MKANAVPLKPDRHAPSRRWLAVVAGVCVTLAVASATGAAPGPVAMTRNGAAAVMSRATDLGPVGSATPIELTVWLHLRDSAALDRTIAAQRSGKAAWLSSEQIDRLHAPAAAEASSVSAFLRSRGLTVTGIGAQNLYVKATGAAATVESAFDVQLHQYSYRGVTFRSSTSSPKLPEDIASLITSVGGLSNVVAKPMIAHPLAGGSRTNIAFQTDAEGLPMRWVPFSGAGAQGLFFSAQCFYPPTTETFSGDGATATYSGGVYGASINNTQQGTLPPCGYQPSDLQTAYALTTLYQAGLNGTGETVAIVDAYGSTTIVQDVATFSSAMGLPPASLKVIGTATGTPYSSNSNLAGWADETTLDVEWAHAVAPGAKIILVVAPSNSFDDLFTAIATASEQPGVVAISNSWGGDESLTDVPTRAAADSVLKLATAKGITVNFAAGDSGNEAINLGYEDVNYPASSPYATAVGGVSVALDSSKHVLFETAWGNNITQVAGTIADGSPVEDPPVSEGFIYGGGGGESNVYPLPSFQSSLTSWGSRRLVPDISWVADPYTGVEIIAALDAQGDEGIGVVGGTSVATPLFSALWSIAVQKAQGRLGQAAPLLYRLPPGAITDVTAPVSLTNVTGTLTDQNGPQKLTAPDLALPLQGLSSYVSALYNSPFSTSWFVLTFGTDSSLATGPGWDPATGLGTPNAPAFVDALGGYH